jgi:hypothetical protein
MLNAGSEPLKFTSYEIEDEAYSEISQTQKTIELKIDNLKGDLGKVGIKLDGENSKIDFSAGLSTFTGKVEATSFAVTPSGSNSRIELLIYNPSATNDVT